MSMHQTATFLFFLSLSLLHGCDAAPPSRDDLGHIVFDTTEVPGADEAYSLPKHLRPTPAEEEVMERLPH